tara:strand:+ start:937 stop:1563 length:627 start_codon:yes stop_codon:yes gene_type:complete
MITLNVIKYLNGNNKMKVTIHQPEHFPYEGFFQKISSADLFVVLDNVKFRKNYFQNRNKFLNSQGNDEWFTVPVEKKAASKKIKDVLVSNHGNWRKKLNNKIKQNLNLDISNIYDADSLLEINMRSIKWCMKELSITTPMVMASELDVRGEKSQLLSSIVSTVGGKHYISGPSGKDYLDMSFFSGIEVSFFTPNVKNYYSMLYNISKR